MDNPRCDVLITRGQKHAVFPQKLAVGAQLSKLVGWDRPTEVRVEAGTELAAFLGGLFAGGGTLDGNNQSAVAGMATMSNASRRQAVPHTAAGVDTQAGARGFRDPVWRLERLYSIRTRDGSVIKFAPRPQQRPDHRPDLPAGVPPNHHFESQTARLLDALGRHLRGPALLRGGAADFID